MGSQYDSNLVLPWILLGCVLPGGASKVGAALWAISIAKQKLVHIKSDSSSIRFSQPAHASSEFHIICIDRPPHSLLSALCSYNTSSASG